MSGAIPALSILATFFSDASYAVLVGILLAGCWLTTASEGRKQLAGHGNVISAKLNQSHGVCLTVLVVCHLTRPWFVASSMSGSTQFETTLALVPTILSSTRQGGLWYANSVALAALIAAHFFIGKRSAWITRAIATAALCVLAATKAASSHASEEGDFTLSEMSQFVHLLATSVWAGAIVVSGFLVVPRWAEGAGELWSYGRRLSQTVTWAVGVLVLAGLYVSWRDMHGAVNVLWVSPWGRLLLTKGSFVGVALLLGSLNRFRCLARPVTGELAITMRNLLRAEACVMLVTLGISGLLGNTNPGL